MNTELIPGYLIPKIIRLNYAKHLRLNLFTA